MGWFRRIFRTTRYQAGQWIDTHDGPGGPLEPAKLVRLVHGPDDHGIEVWEVEYDSRPGTLTRRAYPCQCRGCKRGGW